MSWESIDSYDYELPRELVAHAPASERSTSRLIAADISAHSIEHRTFSDLPNLLDPGDLLIFNDVRVVHARVKTHKEGTGGAVELLVFDVVEPTGLQRWESRVVGMARLRCMTRSSKPLRPGQALVTESGHRFTVEEWAAGVAVVTTSCEDSVEAMLAAVGDVPLPPYIVKRRKEIEHAPDDADDEVRYQTVYASQPGAVAAPTAGLHFDEELLRRLDDAGIERASITLHVGPGTFRPVTSERLTDHEMHTETYVIGEGLREKIEACTGRIVAIGTTTVRTLEAEARRDAPFEPGERKTDLFIRPGFDFKVVDAMVTNFHLPRSTLLALVYAFGGPEFMRGVYEHAVAERYRFYSYGDAMLLAGGLFEATS